MLLNQNNLMIACMASKEESRFTLNGVTVRKDCTFVTDGHTLVKVGLPKASRAEFPLMDGLGELQADFRPFVIPSASATALVKSMPKKEKIPILNHVCLGVMTDGQSRVKIGHTDLDSRTVQEVELCKGNPPDIDRVILPRDRYDIAVSLNAEYLQKIAGLIAKIGKPEGTGKTPAVTLYLKHGNKDAVLLEAVTTDDQPITALIMPMRCSAGDEFEKLQAEKREKPAAAVESAPVAEPAAQPAAAVRPRTSFANGSIGKRTKGGEGVRKGGSLPEVPAVAESPAVAHDVANQPEPVNPNPVYAGLEVGARVMLGTGHGYWDVTHYSYGGKFGRLAADTPAVIEQTECGPSRLEFRVRFEDGRQAMFSRRAILSVAVAEPAPVVGGDPLPEGGIVAESPAVAPMPEIIAYCVQCVDKASGETGSFGYDVERYQRGEGYHAISPIFESLAEFFPWAKLNGYASNKFDRSLKMYRVIVEQPAVAEPPDVAEPEPVTRETVIVSACYVNAGESVEETRGLTYKLVAEPGEPVQHAIRVDWPVGAEPTVYRFDSADAAKDAWLLYADDWASDGFGLACPMLTSLQDAGSVAAVWAGEVAAAVQMVSIFGA